MSRKQRASKNRISLSLLIGVALVLLCACDHGIGYRPRGWSSTQPNRWSSTFDKVEIEIPEIGGLIGTESLMPEIVIHNHGDSVVVLESAVLKTRLADYTARPTEYLSPKYKTPKRASPYFLAWKLWVISCPIRAIPSMVFG